VPPGGTLLRTGQEPFTAPNPPVQEKPVNVAPGGSLVTPQGAILYQAPLAKEPDPITRTETIIGKSGKEEVVGVTQSGQIKPIGQAPAKKSDKGSLPSSALRMAMEEMDAVGTASSIQADLKSIGQQLDSGKIKLGPLSNMISSGRNFLGASTEERRNYSTFKATLEKLRNDSLRLNRGVQTEGDAQRAWNELIENINDERVVRQRLSEIEAINERAANLRRSNVENIYANYGMTPPDMGRYTQQPAAVGGKQAQPSGALNADEQKELERLRKKYGR
jgi:hypothetical protein